MQWAAYGNGLAACRGGEQGERALMEPLTASALAELLSRAQALGRPENEARVESGVASGQAGWLRLLRAGFALVR